MQAAAANDDRLARGVAVGRYIIIDHLGSGEMGAVYAAYDPELDRRIALKLLHARARTDENSSAGRERLLREAQALAQLAHPNVVAIHDVGTTAAGVFIAMELVVGRTLGEWLREHRSAGWRRIAPVLLAAGEGLAAAHRAGIVHRDFKPDNVIVGDDGRVRVVDFGVARLEGPTSVPGTAVRRPTRAPVDAPSISALESLAGPTRDHQSMLTQDGQLVGTPRYMAPEQHLGEGATAGSDQFAFALCVYEAVYGEAPFEGDGSAYIERLVFGSVRAAPAESHVPRWLRSVLLRALSTEPRDRYASMGELLLDLQAHPAARQRRWGVGALVLLGVALVGTAGTLAQRQRYGMCHGADRKLDDVWDETRRKALSDAFARTSAPYATQAARDVIATLDAYTREWVEQRTDACEATRLRGDQSEELLDLRVQCLDGRLAEVRARTELLVAADAMAVEKAAESVHHLPPLAACRDTVGLRSPVRLPSVPAAREKLEAIRERVAKAAALADAAHTADAANEAKASVEMAGALGYAPALAEALHVRAIVEDRAGDYEASAATEREAIAAAEEGHHEETAAEAWAGFVQVTGERLGRYDEARGLLWVARAKVTRLSQPADLRARLLLLEATLEWRKGRYDSAGALARRAVASAEAIHGASHPDVGRAVAMLGIVLNANGHVEESERCHARDLAIEEAAFRAEHPRAVSALTHLADVRGSRGDHSAAVALYLRALAIDLRALRPEHPIIAKIHNNLGDELLSVGQIDDAIAHYERALAIWESPVAPNYPDVATGLHNLGHAYLAKKDVVAAIPKLQRAVDMRVAAFGPIHFWVVGDLLDLGAAFEAKGDAAQSRALQSRAVDLDAKLPPKEREYELVPKVRLGEAQLLLGKGETGIQTLREALIMVPNGTTDELALKTARAHLSRATSEASRSGVTPVAVVTASAQDPRR